MYNSTRHFLFRFFLLTFCFILQLSQSGILLAKPFPHEIQIKCSKTKVQQGKRLKVTIKIRSRLRRYRALRLPKSPALLLRNKQVTKRKEAQYRAGKEPFLIYVWEIKLSYQARKTGTFQTSKAQILFGRKSYQSNSLTFEVIKAKTSSSKQFIKPKIPFNFKPKSKLFLLAQASSNTVFIGQQLSLTYFLFRRGSIEKTNYIRFPQLAAFWSEEKFRAQMIGDWDITRIRGKEYRYTTILRYTLFPLRTGRIKVSPLVMRASQHFSYGRSQQKILKSATVTIQSKALPHLNRPKQFVESHIGQFQIKARLIGKNFSVKKPAFFEVTIYGKGNIRSVQLDPSPKPENLQIISNRTEIKLQLHDFFMKGRKTFFFLIIPQKVGRYEVPSFSLSYFDPEHQKYKKASTARIPFIVNVATKQEPSRSNPQKASGLKLSDLQAQLSRPIVIGMIIGFIIFLLLLSVLWRRKNGKPLTQNEGNFIQKQHQKTEQESLQQLQEWAEQPTQETLAQSYPECEKRLRALFESRLKIVTKGLQRNEIFMHLEKTGIHPQLLQELQQLYQLAEQHRFAPWQNQFSTQQLQKQVLEFIRGWTRSS